MKPEGSDRNMKTTFSVAACKPLNSKVRIWEREIISTEDEQTGF